MNDYEQFTASIAIGNGLVLPADHERRMREDPDYAAKVQAHDAKIAKLAAEDAERRRADEAKRHRQRLVDYGIPVKDVDAILANSSRQTPALEAVRLFLGDGKARILVLSGRRGCGKTFAAGWAIAQPCAERYQGRRRPEYHPRFVDVGDLASGSWFDRDETRALRCCDVLAIDDLGMEYVDTKGGWLSRLDQLVNARYANSIRTVITTNMPAKQFREQYGERIADRIREVGRFANVDGESLRGRNDAR
jgi:DNA replication protein DnaC